MLFGVPEQEHLELLLGLLHLGPNLTLNAGVVLGHQHRRRLRQFVAQRVALDQRVLQPAVHFAQAVAGALRRRVVRAVRIEVGRQDVDILEAEVGTALLGCPQLLLVGRDLVLEEALRILHVGAVRSRGAFDEDRQQCLHHVVRQLWARAAVGDGEEVPGLRRHLDVGRQALQQTLAVGRAGDAEVEIGLRDQLLEVGPAEQGALQHFKLADRGGVSRQAAQQRREDRIGIDIQPRTQLILVGHQIDADPADAADQPGDEDADPAAAPRGARILL